MKQRSSDNHSHAGWSKDGSVFVLGEIAYTADGQYDVVNPLLKGTLADQMKPTGSPEPWLKMAKRMIAEPDLVFTYALCAGLAAPLMDTLSSKGSMAVSLYSMDSGFVSPARKVTYSSEP